MKAKKINRTDAYACSNCGLEGHKLWRQYQTIASAIELLCVKCAERKEKKKLVPGEGDQIGWLVPAVPVEGEDTFWGYTSVPTEGCLWWHALPTFHDDTKRELEWLRAQEKKLREKVAYYQERELERLGIATS